MSAEDDLDWARTLGAEEARRRTEEEAWWAAVEAGDRAGLPASAPPTEVLRPLDDEEQAELTSALFGTMSAEHPSAESSFEAAPSLEAVPSLEAAPSVEAAPSLESAPSLEAVPSLEAMSSHEVGASPGPRLQAVPGAGVGTPRRRWGVLAGGSALAAAAVVLLLFVPRGPKDELPAYAFSLVSGEQLERSGDAPSRRLKPGSRFELQVRPLEPTATKVELSASWRGPRAQARPFGGRVEARNGAFRLTGVVGEELDLEPGEWELQLWLHRPGAPAEGEPTHRVVLQILP